MLEQMKAYRIDRRGFSKGEVIHTAGEFLDLQPEGAKAMEAMFERVKPEGKSSRLCCLFLFENLDVATKHWTKMAKGKIYEVKVNEDSILHRGDMALTDQAYQAYLSQDNREIEENAEMYWAGKSTDCPKIEILVESAIVSRVISRSECERKEALKKWTILSRPQHPYSDRRDG